MTPPVNLSKHTRTQLSVQSHSPSHFSTIQCADVIVGLLKSDQVPSRVALPSGLEHVVQVDASLQQLLEAEHVPLKVLSLCYTGNLCVSPSNLHGICEKLKNAHLVLVGGKLLDQHATLRDVVAESGDNNTLHEVQVYEDATIDPVELSGLSLSESAEDRTGSYNVQLSVIAYCAFTATRKQVLDQIAQAVHRVLQVAYSVDEHFDVVMSHYPILGSDLVVTVVSPSSEESEEETSETLMAWRRSMHDKFMLLMNRPLVRRSCRLAVEASTVLARDGGCVGRLSNVHIGVKTHGLGKDGVTEHLVDGDYLYCHYMQDKFNDSGWGCAYRSLQTILSWCVFQKYISFEGGVLPTHEQIQKSLVDVGDKLPKFLGSKEWIGANEVCYALEKLTGVPSKILHVSTGAEMESKGRELARHFDEQGSPVMVGGGVLAWTILGVARNSRTGKTKFLILDPHFEGKDDLKVIQKKGWIAWKGAEVFKKDAFYNLCMPLRPSAI